MDTTYHQGSHIFLAFAASGALCLSSCATAVFLSSQPTARRPVPATTTTTGTAADTKFAKAEAECKAFTPWCMGQDKYDEYIKRNKRPLDM